MFPLYLLLSHTPTFPISGNVNSTFPVAQAINLKVIFLFLSFYYILQVESVEMSNQICLQSESQITSMSAATILVHGTIALALIIEIVS